MVLYSVREDDGKVFTCTPSFEKAKKIKKENPNLHIYEITTWNGWEEKELLTL